VKNTFNITISLVAGLLGGLLTRYITPSAAFAQDQKSAVKEIRAQSFVFVGPADQTLATLGVEMPNKLAPNFVPRIVLRDANGHEMWSAPGGGPKLLTASPLSR
jgi:hypothetical protein